MRRWPSRRCRAPAAPARVEASRSVRPPLRRVAPLGEGLLAQLADLLGLHPHRAATSRAPPRGRSRPRPGTDRGSSTRRRRGPARPAAGEQPAMLEEHVHQLPQHVVTGLHELLPHEGIGARRLQLPLGSRPARRRSSGNRSARPLERRAISRLGRAEREHVSSGSADRPPGRGAAALAGQPDRRQGALADDHRMDGLDGDMANVRASGGGGPTAISRPPRANRSAIAWHSRAIRSASPRRTARSQACAARAARDAPAEPRSVGVSHAGAGAAASRVSHSRNSSVPSPVLELSAISRARG